MSVLDELTRRDPVVTVFNRRAHELSVDGVTFKPGANELDAKQWAELKTNHLQVRTWVANEWLIEHPSKPAAEPAAE